MGRPPEGRAQTIDVTINGEPCSLQTPRLDHALEALGFGGVKVATAVNGTFVSAANRDAYTLSPGDRVEVVSARAGG